MNKSVKPIVAVGVIICSIIVLLTIGGTILAIVYVSDKALSDSNLQISNSIGEDSQYKDSYTNRYRKQYTLDEIKRVAKNISYKDLSRTPDNYVNEVIYFKGKVIQVLEDSDKKDIALRVNTKLSDYQYFDNDYIDDTIYVYIDEYDKNNRILEDDIIEIWGVYAGIMTYESVLGSQISIPEMLGVYWTIAN